MCQLWPFHLFFLAFLHDTPQWWLKLRVLKKNVQDFQPDYVNCKCSISRLGREKSSHFLEQKYVFFKPVYLEPFRFMLQPKGRSMQEWVVFRYIFPVILKQTSSADLSHLSFILSEPPDPLIGNHCSNATHMANVTAVALRITEWSPCSLFHQNNIAEGQLTCCQLEWRKEQMKWRQCQDWQYPPVLSWFSLHAHAAMLFASVIRMNEWMNEVVIFQIV